MHCLPGGHALSQPPQCWLETSVSTHVPLHSSSAAGHLHLPPWHEAPPAQTFPHAPQSVLLVLTSVHTPPQSS